ncbi:MAG: uncharacterized protein A8A55_3397, partial [Amphiamblys sp. WSBS2006]
TQLRDSISDDEAEIVRLKVRVLNSKRSMRKVGQTIRHILLRKEQRENPAQVSPAVTREQGTPVTGETTRRAGESQKRLRTERAQEALAGLLCPTKKPENPTVATVAAVLPRAPYGKTRRRLEALGPRSGVIAHLDVVGEKLWFTGEARGIATILAELKKGGVLAEQKTIFPEEWAESIRRGLRDTGIPARKKEMTELALPSHNPAQRP